VAEPAPPIARTPADLVREVWLVLLVSLGRSAVYAVVYFTAALTAGRPLAQSAAPLNSSRAPGRPTLDLTYQLLGVFFALVPVALAWHFLRAAGERPARVLGVDAGEPRRDAVRGVALAVLVGGTGLALYLIAYSAGINLRVVASGLPEVWWRVPVLVLSAVQNAVLEELLVAGYLLHRLGQLGWTPWRAAAASALLRGTYHLYQGLGGFAGNLVMGLLFARLYQRWGRTLPLVVAHALIDTVAFVGYALLHGRVGWLP